MFNFVFCFETSAELALKIFFATTCSLHILKIFIFLTSVPERGALAMFPLRYNKEGDASFL